MNDKLDQATRLLLDASTALRLDRQDRALELVASASEILLSLVNR